MPTEKARSGLEFTRYLKLPRRLLNFDAFATSSGLPSNSFICCSMGVSTGLHPFIPEISTIFSA
jgi:hypothetical protein